MHRSLAALAFALAFTAPASAQDTVVIPASPPPALVVAPPPVYAPPPQTADPQTGFTPYYASVGRRGEQRLVIGTRHETQTDRGLWGAGLGLFLGGWVFDIAVTAVGNAISSDRTDANEQDAQAWSLMPFAGPIAQLGIGAPHPAIPLTAGLMQISGLVLFILGFTETHDGEVPIYAFGDPHDARTARVSMGLAPTSGGAVSSFTLTF